MDRTVVIKLIQESFTKDAYGVQIPTETTHEVYAQVESVTLSEWSEGGRHGLNPELRFIMFAPDYHRERIIEYNNVRYTVYRTYHERNDKIELYCERRSGSD